MRMIPVTVTSQEVLDEGCCDIEFAATTLGKSETTIYRLIKRKILPHISVDSGKSIPKAGLRKLIDQQLIQSN